MRGLAKVKVGRIENIGGIRALPSQENTVRSQSKQKPLVTRIGNDRTKIENTG